MKKILVVDNNPVILKLMSELLRRHGHDVACANDALECLDIVVEWYPDVIFLDLIMPRIGGEDLCRILRRNPHIQESYIGIVSAIAIEEEVDYRQMGADCCIAKGPFDEMSRHILQAISDSEKPREANAEADVSVRGAEGLHSRQITRELLLQNKHHRAVLESISQGIVEIELDRIIFANRQAIEMLGVKIEQLLGKRYSDSFPPLLVEAVNSFPLDSEGRVLPASSSPLDINGRQLIAERFSLKHYDDNQLLIISDITERKQMEAVIEATNLTKNLGYVFSGIRHEIGNPVNSIKVALSVLQRNLKEYDKSTIAEFVDRSLQEITRIEYLLKALKNYSLFEKPDIKKLPIADFMTQFIPLVKNDFEGKGIKIEMLISDENLMILADSRALHHVMLNLMTNAADALEGHERPQIFISIIQNGSWVEIKVNDNGKGMSKADHKNLFKPFSTVKASGTGLGLVIVKKMLTAMKGDIGIESYQGIGTTVTISLPEARGEV
jgi:two-component system, cell cycle sensor histidine kinase and response regulator CckA